MTDALGGQYSAMAATVRFCPVDGVCKTAACLRWRILAELSLMTPIRNILPAPLLLSSKGVSAFTLYSEVPSGSKERCPPAVIVGLVSAPHTKPCCKADAYVWWLTYFLASLHMRGKEEGGRGATLSEKS